MSFHGRAIASWLSEIRKARDLPRGRSILFGQLTSYSSLVCGSHGATASYGGASGCRVVTGEEEGLL